MKSIIDCWDDYFECEESHAASSLERHQRSYSSAIFIDSLIVSHLNHKNETGFDLLEMAYKYMQQNNNFSYQALEQTHFQRTIHPFQLERKKS